MTLRCPSNGPSQITPGTGNTVVFSAALITGGLTLISPWLLPVAGLVDSFSYAALSQCTGDPPAMPTPDQLNPLNAIGGVLNPSFPAWETAVSNLLLNWAWDQYCQCVSGTASPVTYPGPPAGTTIPTVSGGAPCYVGSVDVTVNTEPSFNHFAQRNYPVAIPNTGATQTFVVGGVNVDAIALSTVPTKVTLSGHFTSQVVGRGYAMELAFWDAGGTQLSTPQPNAAWTAAATTEDHISTFNIPSTAAWCHIAIDDLSGNASTAHATVSATWYCGAGSSPGTSSPCLDTSELLQLLQTVLQLCEAIYSALPLPINSYLEATVHNGLTGSGTLTIAPNCIAIKVTITTDLPGGRIDLGSPNYLFDRGYIVPIAAEGPIRNFTRLVYNPQLYALPNLTDQVGYSFPAGEVVTITELTRGP